MNLMTTYYKSNFSNLFPCDSVNGIFKLRLNFTLNSHTFKIELKIL